MVREVKRNEVEEEIRKQVDNLMRDELDLLKIVNDFTKKNRGQLLLIFIICIAGC